MPVLSTSYDVYSGDEAVLAASITETDTTGIKFSTVRRNQENEGWATADRGVVEVSQELDGELKVEYMSYGGGTYDDEANFVPTDISRNIPRDGSTLVGTGTGQRFNRNANVRLVMFHYNFNQKANLDRTNNWSAAQTLGAGGRITPTNTTTPVYGGQRLTTAQRDALTGVVDGDWIYNITLNQTQWREGGSWVTNAVGGTVADSSTTVTGKSEEATTTEVGTSVATGGTGSRLFINPSSVAKTSAGAGDENKIPALGAAGTLADGHLGTGTASASNVLLGNRTWGTLQGSADKMFGVGSDGVPTWTSGASLNPATEKGYTTATLPVSQTLTVSTVNVPLIIHSTGDVVINGTIDLNGKGAAGGAGGAGATTDGVGLNGVNGTNGNSLVTGLTTGAGGFGAGGSVGPATGGVGGSGGASAFANGSGGSAGTRIDAAFMAWLANIHRGVCCGAGGGGGGGGAEGGGSGDGGLGGTGGAGGGAMVMMIGGNLTLGVSSVIRANGSQGTEGANVAGADGGDGGSGGGGSVLIIVSGTITNNGATLSATAGAALDGVGSGGTGSAGGAGRVLIYSLSTGTLITA